MEIKFFLHILIMSSMLVLSHDSLHAQKTQDVIYLKDGSILKGTITEQIPDSIIMLEIEGGSIWVIKFRDILRSTTEKISVNSNRNSKAGYCNLTAMAPLAGSNYYGGYTG